MFFGGRMKSLFALAATALCLFSTNAFAVYGGGQLPTAMLGSATVVRIEGDYLCSAVVLSSRTLLTAAHCTEEMDWNGSTIRVVHPDTGDKQKNRVAGIVRHPHYKIGFAGNPTLGQIYTDIAIVKLKSAISFPHQPVSLASSFDLQRLSQLDIFLVANGSNAKSETSHNSALRMIVRQHPHSILETESTKLQAGPCINDSGGGLFIVEGGKVRLLGIQSSKNETDCDSSQSRGYVVDIPSNLNWILQALN